MEQLDRARTLIERGQYEEAFLLLGECVDRALRELDADRRARRNGTILALGVAFLTGGLGLEDLIWGPLAYKAARTFGGGTMKPEEALLLLVDALDLRILMLEKLPEYMVRVETPVRVLRDILLVYLMLKQKEELFRELLPKLADASMMQRHPYWLVRYLIDEIGDKRFYDVDTLLFICLFLYDLRHWELYQKLRIGREWLERELESIGQEASHKSQRLGAELDAALEQHYAALLELEAPYTPEKVRRNYRRLIKACHPDHFQQASATERRAAEERARELNEAYEYFRARLNF